MDVDPDNNLLELAVPFDSCKYYTTAEFSNQIVNHVGFSMLNYNVRSFHRNGTCFQTMIDSLNYHFDCLILTETWNNESNVQLCNLPGYNDFHTYRPKNHIYSISGGVSVFCIDSCRASKNSTLSICNANIESCVIEIESSGNKFAVVAVYRPPQGSKSDFIEELDLILNNLNSNALTVSILGDFNLNYGDCDDSSVLEFCSNLYSRSFISLINKPTRFPTGNLNSTPTTLDMIWTNSLNVSFCGVLDFDVTDHLPTFSILKLPNIEGKSDKIKIQSRPYTEENLQKFCSDLAEINWNEELNYDDIENCIIIFSQKMNLSYQKCFPIKTKFISNKRLNNKWLGQGLKHLINKKSQAFKQFRNGQISKEENNRIKNEINSKIRKAKFDYFRCSFERFKGNMKKSWNLLSNLMGRKKNKREIITLLDGTTELVDEGDVANKFADYFSTIGQNLDSNLQNSTVSPYQHVNRNSHSFYLFPVTVDECQKIISKLKLTSTDLNQTPVKIFKSVMHIVSDPIMKIINSSFRQGIFPKFLKIAKITPVHKKGDKKVHTNYRPISSLHYISKIFERAMADRLLSFFKKFKLFSKKQFGFLKGRSTADALLDFAENIYDSLNSKNII